MKDDTSTPIGDSGASPNEFESDRPGTSARTLSKGGIETLRVAGGGFVEAVRATRMPMLLTDPTLAGNPIVFANAAFLKLSGYGMDEVLGQQPDFMNGPDTDPKDAARFREMVRADRDEILVTVQYGKNGRRFVATVLISAFKDDTGRTLHHFMSWLEVTRRVDAEEEASDLRQMQAALRESEERLSLVFQALPVGVAIIDQDGNTVRMNDEMRRFLPTGTIPSRDTEQRGRWIAYSADGSVLEPRDYPGSRALRGDRVVPGIETVYRQDDGEAIWTRVASVPLPEGDNQTGGAFVIVVDIDDIKRSEEALRQSERHARTLLAELQHRVRNTLAVVRSIARRTADGSASLDEMVSHFEGRLSAFSRVQSIVTRSPNAGINLKSVIDDELMAVSGRDQRIPTSGPEICFQPRTAERLTLAIHELATNAVKYGALSAEAGKIRVNWRRIEEDGRDTLRLEWIESGLDEPPKAAREGFGHELLLRSLPYDLGAETSIEFTADGLRFTMSMSLGPDVLAE